MLCTEASWLYAPEMSLQFSFFDLSNMCLGVCGVWTGEWAHLDLLTILSVTDGEARASELNKTIKDPSKRNRFSLTAFCKTRNKEFQTVLRMLY